MDKVDTHITCWKKVLYRKLIDAELDAAEIWASKQRDLVPYKCPVCPFWHLANQGWTIKKIEHLQQNQKRITCA